MESTSATLSHYIRILHPSIKTQAKSMKTREYQLSLLETVNLVKFVLVTSVRTDNAPELALNSLYDHYINNVKKNYLYKVGDLIRVSRFEEEVRKVLKLLDEKWWFLHLTILLILWSSVYICCCDLLWRF